LTCNAGELRRSRSPGTVWEHFPDYLDLLSDFLRERGLVRFLLGRCSSVVSWRARTAGCAAGQEIVEDVTDGLATCPGEGDSGDAGPAGGMVTRDADGDGERDPVRVDPGRAGRFGPQGAQSLVVRRAW
jgi:hypothetical protein